MMNAILKTFATMLLLTHDSAQCRWSVTKMNSDSVLSLPIPNPKYMKIEDPAHVTVRWDPVKVSDDNPILGFKVKLWEDEKQKVIIFTEENGKETMVEEWRPVEKSPFVLPTHAPAFEAVVPPDVFQASFDVKQGEHYEVRAQSYNAAGDGPLSIPHGFRIHTEEETKLYLATSEKPKPGDDGGVKVTILRDFD